MSSMSSSSSSPALQQPAPTMAQVPTFCDLDEATVTAATESVLAPLPVVHRATVFATTTKRNSDDDDDDDGDDGDAYAATTPDSLCNMYLSDELIDRMVLASNAYAKRACAQYEQIRHEHILQFIAIIYYMGVVRLRTKAEYWDTHDILPSHAICRDYGMTYSLFTYLWRYVRCTEETGALNADEEKAEDDGDGDGGGDGGHAAAKVDGVVWYNKTKPFIDVTNAVSAQLCTRPGFVCTIDDTCNSQLLPTTVVALCCAQSGFVYNMCARANDDTGEAAVALLRSLPLQPTTDSKPAYVVVTARACHAAIVEAHSMNVGMVGMMVGASQLKNRACAPSTMYTQSSPSDRYVAHRWANEDGDTEVFVSSVHAKVGVAVTTNIPQVAHDYRQWSRAGERATRLLTAYQPLVQCRRTWLPLLIHCLNVMRSNAFVAYQAVTNDEAHDKFMHDWIRSIMGRARQRIARRQYAHNRQEALAVASTVVPRPSAPVSVVVAADSSGAAAAAEAAAAAAAAAAPPPKQPVLSAAAPQSPSGRGGASKKRSRLSSKVPTLPAARLQDPSDHVMTSGRKQRTCVMCRYLNLVSRGTGGDEQPTKIRKVVRGCAKCDVNLCRGHFLDYHRTLPGAGRSTV